MAHAPPSLYPFVQLYMRFKIMLGRKHLRMCLYNFNFHTNRKSNKSISAYWQVQAEQTHGAFISYTGSSPTAFVETIYHKFIAKTNDSVIDQAITSIRHFQDKLDQSERHNLQLDGVGDRLRIVREKGHDMAMVISWLEEIWC